MSCVFVFVVGSVDFFMSHRLGLAKYLTSVGASVHVVGPASLRASELEALGVSVHVFSLKRGSVNLWMMMRACVGLFLIFRRLQPTAVHLIAGQPILVGSVVCALLRVEHVFWSITGLGSYFVGWNMASFARKALIKVLYYFSYLVSNPIIIFQNSDDARDLSLTKIIGENGVIISGSGVDVSSFDHLKVRLEPKSRPSLVMFIGRMIYDKGVYDFYSMASKIRHIRPDVKFVLVGDTDPNNPSCVPARTILKWSEAGTIEWWGRVREIQSVLNQAGVLVLPSYREGFPKVLMEAAAAGVPSVAYDVPGSRQAIHHNCSGLLVPVRDVDALSEAVLKLLDDIEEYARISHNAKRLAKAAFDVQTITQQHVWIYQKHLFKN